MKQLLQQSMRWHAGPPAWGPAAVAGFGCALPLLLGLFSAEVTGRDFKMEPATLFDMVGKTEIIKPTLEVIYDAA